jgi:hypothetical protein
MRQVYVLRRRSRVFGALVCVALGVTEIAWVVGDTETVGAQALARVWFGLTVAGVPLTSVVDLVLIGLYAGTAVAVSRPVGAGALGAAAAVTLALRLPSLWILTAGWTQGAPSRQQLLLTVVAELAGAGVLLLTAVAGRRPAFGDDVVPVPARERVRVPAGLLLIAVALLEAGWQLYFVRFFAQNPTTGSYVRTITGENAIPALLATPSGWLGWAIAALGLGAGVAALRRLPPARPLGIVVAWLVALTAAPDIGAWAQQGQFLAFNLSDLASLGSDVTLRQLTLLFEIAAAVVLVVLLAPPGSGGPARALDPFEARDTIEMQTMPSPANYLRQTPRVPPPPPPLPPRPW